MSAPSPWVERFAHLVPEGAPVLDLACGGGRHARLFAARGHAVTLVDINLRACADLLGRRGYESIEADLEAGPWPLAGRTFGAVVVTRYLWRPLFPRLVAAVAPGGALIYETFAQGHAAYGRPRNPDHLLQPGELLEAAGPLQVVAYEHGRIDAPFPSVVQRLAATRGEAPASIGPR
jgi:SAM-dependent methyltransferase